MKRIAMLMVVSLIIGCGTDVFVNPDKTIVSDFTIMIEKTHGSLQGGFIDVDVTLIAASDALGGYSLLLAYNASALTFQGATPGELLTDCGWEYFTYRYGDVEGCEGGCPSGLVSLTAIAETNNGPNHPVADCNPQAITMTTLNFLVSNDRTLNCQYIPIRFFWVDCTDNTLTNVSGELLHIASTVREYPYDGETLGENLMEVYPDAVLPTFTGPMGCAGGDKNDIVADINFINGGIDIVCSGIIDPYGDLNLDGLSYTIADAVMYSNYFIQGMAALVYVAEPNQYGQIPGYAASVAASDVNADGNSLTVADFVYLTRIMIGEALPNQQAADTVLAQLTDSNSGTLSIDQPMGAVLVIFEGEITPVLLAENVEMKFSFDGVNTRVLVYSFDGNSFVGNFLQAENDIVSIELATPEGKPVILSD